MTEGVLQDATNVGAASEQRRASVQKATTRFAIDVGEMDAKLARLRAGAPGRRTPAGEGGGWRGGGREEGGDEASPSSGGSGREDDTVVFKSNLQEKLKLRAQREGRGALGADAGPGGAGAGAGMTAAQRSKGKPMSIFGRTPGGAGRGIGARGGARRVIPGEEMDAEEDAAAAGAREGLPVLDPTRPAPVIENPETLGVLQDDTQSSAGSAGRGSDSSSGALMGTAVQALRAAGGGLATSTQPRAAMVTAAAATATQPPRAALRVVAVNDENMRPSNDENAPPPPVPPPVAGGAGRRVVPATPLAPDSASRVPHPATLYKAGASAATPSGGLSQRPPASAMRPMALEPRAALIRESAPPAESSGRSNGGGASDLAASAFRTPAAAGAARAPLGAVAPTSSRGALAPLQTPMATPGGRVSLATLMELAAEPEAPQQLSFSDAEPYENDSEVAVNGRVYHKLACVGKGGSCRVYKVIEPQSRKLYAVKRVQLNEDTDIQPFINEIQLLQKMQGR